MSEDLVIDTQKMRVKSIKAKSLVVKPKIKVLASHLFKGSRKDLINVIAQIRKVLRTKNYLDTMAHLKLLIENEWYISYKKHLGGIAHHRNLGPSARPKKTYLYVYEVLKNFRWEMCNLKNAKVSRIIINYNNTRHLGGAIMRSRGQSYAKDSRQFYLKFFVHHE